MGSKSPITKKLINSPETCVDDNLRGVLAAYPQLQLHPQHRVISVRRKGNNGRVALLGGGGSGHEPFASGYVGAGMLDAAVAGEVFASPPAGHALYAIRHLSEHNTGGVFFIFGNYTGDRLNFGKAIEKAKAAGIKVESFIVAEDIASSKNKTGGRSMAGEVLIYKICGAMAVEGYDIEAIQRTATEAHKCMAAHGVTLSACSLPGQPPLFEVASDEIELGAGVHGEAGIAKLKMGAAKEVVQMLLDEIIIFLKMKEGDRVVAAINNMGGSSILEMNVVTAETKEFLESRNITVERIFTGHLKTSLEMRGIQICLLNLDKYKAKFWLEMLDAPTAAAGWTGSQYSVKCDDNIADEDVLMQGDGQKAVSGPKFSTKDQDLLRGSLMAAAEELIKNEALLNKLDSGCGDGDCGSTLKKLGCAMLDYLKIADLEYPATILWDLSEIAERDMGGTSGGIYSLGLSAASQTFASEESNNVKIWMSAWESAMKAITKYGGAEPGDRTMLDTLHAGAKVFTENTKADVKILLGKIAVAADEGATRTAEMVAKAGRASYVASTYMVDEDAGARAVAIWMQAVVNYLINNL